MVRESVIPFVDGLRSRNQKHSSIGKTARSLEVIRMNIGQPFYTIMKNTIFKNIQFDKLHNTCAHVNNSLICHLMLN